jgi:predicted transcriptional regulator
MSAIPLQTFLQDLIRASGVPQRDLARRAALTEKHVSEMMCGWSQGKLSAWQALLDAAGVTLPAVARED